MPYKTQKIALVGILLGIIVIATVFIQKTIETSSLSTRPFNIAVASAMDNLEPAQLDNNSQRLVAGAIYEGLVAYDETSQSVQPRLAKSWKYAKDGQSLIINLRKDVKFSNGKKLTAHDVKASWEKSFSTTKDWSNISLFLPVSGCEDKLNGKSPEIYGLKIINDHTLQIKFKKPQASFIDSLTNPIFWVMDLGVGSNPSPGTGPYMVKEKKPQSIILLKNDHYYRGQPHLSALNVSVYPDSAAAYKAYQEGKVDFLDAIPVQELAKIRKEAKYKGLLLEKPVWEIYCLGFNMGRDPYAGSYLLRRALNYAIDRDYIINNILGGSYISAKGLIPAGMEAYNQGMYGYHYKPEKARELLAEAGYPEGRGLRPLTLTYNQDDGHQQVAQEIVRQLGQLGLAVQLQEQNWDYYKRQINSRSMSFFRLGWAADYPDADSFLYSLFHSTKIGVSNYCGYHNPQVDKILDASRAKYNDPQARIKLLRRAEEIIVDDAPCLWLFQKKAEKMVSRDVKNLPIDRLEMVDWYQVKLGNPEPDKDSGRQTI